MKIASALIALVLGWGLYAPAQAQELFPLQAIPNPATVINASNLASAHNLTDGSGAVWSFGAAVNVAFGGYHVLRDGVAQDTPSTNGTWQLVKAHDGTMWAMDMAGDQWYHWAGSWTTTGTAPPVTGNGTPALLEMYPNTLVGATDVTTTPTWLGQVPASIGGLPSGPAAYYSFDGFFPNGGITLSGKDSWPFNITYRVDVCTNAAGNTYCPASPTVAYMPDYAGIIAGKYDAFMTTQMQTYVLPQAKNIYYIRVNSEWAGNFWAFSPWFGSTENSPPCTSGGAPYGYGTYGCGVVPPDVWVAMTQHVITLLRSVVINGPGGNPAIKIEFDAPVDDIQAAYYPGDAYVDVLGDDVYIGSSSPTNARANFMFYQNATGGWFSEAYALTFAQRHNLPFVYPEYCDFSTAPNEVDGTIITLFANLFASVNGPGNAAIVAHGYWDEPPSNGGFQCDFTHDPAKQAAYAQPYPNGFKNAFYNGTEFTVSPMPVPNPWNP